MPDAPRTGRFVPARNRVAQMQETPGDPQGAEPTSEGTTAGDAREEPRPGEAGGTATAPTGDA
ncbi:MAG TPA: hypothetical protein VJM49_20275, partial [Acidimicrobiales bacterium]|nr:hypothetical protein [Acidimicrobiales bacterium]